jgi:hypothetical protein
MNNVGGPADDVWTKDEPPEIDDLAIFIDI